MRGRGGPIKVSLGRGHRTRGAQARATSGSRAVLSKVMRKYEKDRHRRQSRVRKRHARVIRATFDAGPGCMTPVVRPARLLNDRRGVHGLDSRTRWSERVYGKELIARCASTSVGDVSSGPGVSSQAEGSWQPPDAAFPKVTDAKHGARSLPPTGAGAGCLARLLRPPPFVESPNRMPAEGKQASCSWPNPKRAVQCAHPSYWCRRAAYLMDEAMVRSAGGPRGRKGVRPPRPMPAPCHRRSACRRFVGSACPGPVRGDGAAAGPSHRERRIVFGAGGAVCDRRAGRSGVRAGPGAEFAVLPVGRGGYVAFLSSCTGVALVRWERQPEHGTEGPTLVCPVWR